MRRILPMEGPEQEKGIARPKGQAACRRRYWWACGSLLGLSLILADSGLRGNPTCEHDAKRQMFVFFI